MFISQVPLKNIQMGCIGIISRIYLSFALIISIHVFKSSEDDGTVLYGSQIDEVKGSVFRVKEGLLPFHVYFKSHSRGVCGGFLVNRILALTAAICVINPILEPEQFYLQNTQPINVVLGTNYRHIRRGIKVQVTKIFIPKMPKSYAEVSLYIQMAGAALLLKKKIPHGLTEFPMKPIMIDYKGDFDLHPHDECIASGWHFFENGDLIYPVAKFEMRRSLRVQLVHVVNREKYCDVLISKFEKKLKILKYEGPFTSLDNFVCTRDGMYGTPLICGGAVIAILTALDMQWTNCTGHSNMWTYLKTPQFLKFFHCLESFFTEDTPLDIKEFKLKQFSDISQEDLKEDRELFNAEPTSSDEDR